MSCSELWFTFEPISFLPRIYRYNLNVNSTGPIIAPGAENVGETQIVTSFAPAFDLGGLFNQADKGAFGDYDMDGGVGEETQEEYMDEDG